MTTLPPNANLDHLKKQAKDLLRLVRARDAQAIARLREHLPAAAGMDATQIAQLRLHDAQSCIARDYGFDSWADLKSYVEAQQRVEAHNRPIRIFRWLTRVYAGDVTGEGTPRPSVAARMLAEDPDLVRDDPYLACAIGDEDTIRRAIAADPGWVNRAGGLLRLPPLVAVTHSSLLRLPEFRERLHRTAQLLLDAGADPKQTIGNRWPPASLKEPDPANPLSALYGVAGQNQDAALTRLLLKAGADPNDGESLYHSLENIECTRALLEAGARVEGSNAFYRVFDLDLLPSLQLLLAHGANPNEPARNKPLSDWGSPLMWAIFRRRSPAHVRALLEAGADPHAKTADGVGTYRTALRFGLTEVAELLRAAGAAEALSEEEQFIAACARVDEAAARGMLAARPNLLQRLSEAQLRLLPDLAQHYCDDAVRLMVSLGWPIAVTGGDWGASALNLAVFFGNASLAKFLLEHGASWRERHGYDDDLCGTLSFASQAQPGGGPGNWVGCAEALLAHGMPHAEKPPGRPGWQVIDPCWVIIDGRRKRYSEEVVEVLLGGPG